MPPRRTRERGEGADTAMVDRLEALDGFDEYRLVNGVLVKVSPPVPASKPARVPRRKQR